MKPGSATGSARERRIATRNGAARCKEGGSAPRRSPARRGSSARLPGTARRAPWVSGRAHRTHPMPQQSRASDARNARPQCAAGTRSRRARPAMWYRSRCRARREPESTPNLEPDSRHRSGSGTPNRASSQSPGESGFPLLRGSRSEARRDCVPGHYHQGDHRETTGSRRPIHDRAGWPCTASRGGHSQYVAGRKTDSMQQQFACYHGPPQAAATGSLPAR